MITAVKLVVIYNRRGFVVDVGKYLFVMTWRSTLSFMEGGLEGAAMRHTLLQSAAGAKSRRRYTEFLEEFYVVSFDREYLTALSARSLMRYELCKNSIEGSIKSWRFAHRYQ